VSADSLAPIGTVAHYNLLERLEPSGPGDLFRARDTHRGRTVTLRLLPAGLGGRAGGAGGVVAEAQARTALSHPNITTIFDAGEQDDRVYIAFEFVRGRALRSEMAGRQMNVRRALEIAIQMSDAVAETHAAGVVHRGLSPDSIVVTEKGHAKIPTFPLGSRFGFDSATGDLDLVDYESPEEARGEVPDERSDVYSVAAITYEMLTTRRPPHRGASAPSAWNARVSPELDEVVLKALSPNARTRCQSAAELSAGFRRIVSTLDSRGGVDDEEESTAAPSGAWRPMLAAGLVLGLIAAAVWWFTRS
jgi:eukaryotic-like serine/threonine-protein kinase